MALIAREDLDEEPRCGADHAFQMVVAQGAAATSFFRSGDMFHIHGFNNGGVDMFVA